MLKAKSSDFAALGRILAIAGGSPVQAAVIAESTRASESIRQVLKAAVDAGSTSTPAFAGALVESDIVGAFVASLRSRSVFARLLEDGMTRLPLRTKAAVVAADASAFVVSEGGAIPVSAMSLAGSTLTEHRAAGLVVVSNELLRSISPAARALIDNSLRSAVSAALDAKFVDLIADGIVATPATGTTAADALSDLRAMLNAVNTTGNGALFWIMGSDVANRAATLATTGGDLVFAGMSPLGGELVGIPTLVSDAVLSGQLLLVDASGLAGEIDSIVLSTAEHATLQLDTSPTSPPNAAVAMQSLWQTNRAAILATSYFGAERVRANAVVVLDGVEWEGATP